MCNPRLPAAGGSPVTEGPREPALPNVFWPFTNLVNIYALGDAQRGGHGTAAGRAWYAELLIRVLRANPYVFLALLSYYVLPYPNLAHDAPGGADRIDLWALDDIESPAFRWAVLITARNLALTVALYEGWHWVLYESAVAKTFMHRKINPSNIVYVRENPADASSELVPELDRTKGYDPATCRRYSICGVLIESAYELAMLHLWTVTWRSERAEGAMYYTDFFGGTAAHAAASVAWVLFVLVWRDFHFFWVHRLIHPWFGMRVGDAASGWRGKLDLGAFLYKHVHSLHHRSYNTGPWSGLSMHFVEHILYFSCVFFPSAVLRQHPLHFLVNHWHVLISPLPGHDGFYEPQGGGSYFHYLHHAHFECNYGTPLVPLDKLLGSFEDGSKYKVKEA